MASFLRKVQIYEGEEEPTRISLASAID